MDDITGFRGLAGEVVRSFVNPNIFLAVIPVLFFWLFFGIVFFFIGRHLSFPFNALLVIAASSLLVGRFALAASRGDLHAGFFSREVEFSETFAFAGRYCIYTVFWVIPVAIIAWLNLKNLSTFMMMGFSSMAGPGIVQAGFHGFILMLLMVVSIIMPTVSCILSTYTESFAEVFSMQPISWLYHERLHDLLPFFAAVIGGVFVFWLVYIIPLLIVAILAFKISMQAGALVSAFLYALPYLSSPIIIGRMSGAFVMGDFLMGDDDMGAAQATPNPTDPGGFSPAKTTAASATSANTAATAAPAQAAIMSPNPVALRNRVEQLSDQQLQQDLPAVEIKRSSHPNDPNHTLYLAYLYQKLGRDKEASQLVVQALRYAMQHNFSNESAVIFKDFTSLRAALQLQADELERLSEILLMEKHYLDAGWCLHQIMKSQQQEDDLMLQKKLLAVADAANKAGQAKHAFSLYAYFIKNFPQSTLVDYANEGVQKTNQQLKK